MFYDELLQNHLETSSSVKNRSAVFAEWNMNIPDNIFMVGNYRYRPTKTDFKYLPVQFDIEDPTHKNATFSDVEIGNGFDNENIPISFSSVQQKENLYYSLEDCLGRFRPRSGINKVRSFGTNSGLHFLNGTTENGLGQSYLDTNRPRYYASDRDDRFKYWTSYRTEGQGVEYGVANRSISGLSEYGIEDAVPFVVYKENVPANRVVVKMQTNVGTVTVGDIITDQGTTIPDPLYGNANKTTPVKWKVQGLVGDSWEDLKTFNANSQRRNGDQIVGPDGYLELSYGLIIPERYRNIFIKAETYSTAALLPARAVNGYAYLIKESATDLGTYYIWLDEAEAYETFIPQYGWDIAEETVNRFTHFVNDLTDPDAYIDQTNQFRTAYREFQYLRGIRVVVETMNKLDSTFDLIEMSTRLNVNITEKVKTFSLKKPASDLGISGLPVGQLLVATGNLEIFDYDDSFNSNNTNSIISKYASNEVQFKFYDVIAEVLDGAFYYDYYVPLKTLYGDGFPQRNIESRTISMQLRDMFIRLESAIAPQIFVRDASLSYAVSFLLDNIGFSNYVFKRTSSEKEPIIPFFYVEPDVTVAEILNEIARSTQTAMFFDEYNNFVMMTKNYMMPSITDRPVDVVLNGSKDFERNGLEKNSTTKTKLANIVGISSQDTSVYNDGKINYTTRYIQKSYSSLDQADRLGREKTWTYSPSLLWEVSPSSATKTQNEENGSLSTYALTAIPLKTDLTSALPTVAANGTIVNNIIDFGDAAELMGRYNGYFYANGEIIRYDAIEFSVFSGEGTAWISSLEEYQDYFSKIPFNGKLYPTGRVRIYSKPFYNKQTGLPVSGKVEKHGRGQFGTSIVEHKAGLDGSEWVANISGVTMDSDYLFSSIGNFQLKDAYVPYKATLPIKFFNALGKPWKIEGPLAFSTIGTVTSSASGSTNVDNLSYEKNYTYNLLVDNKRVYSVTQNMKEKLNADGVTSLGNIDVININGSDVITQVTLPTYASFFKPGQTPTINGSFAFSIRSSALSTPITGTISPKVIPAVIDSKTKKVKTPARVDTTKTIVAVGNGSGVEYTGIPVLGITLSNNSTITLNDVTFLVGSESIKTFSVLAGPNTGAIQKITGALSYNNRAIYLDDTSAIKVGQKIILNKVEEVLQGTQTITSNPFNDDNKNELRVDSVFNQNIFYIRYKDNTSGGLRTTSTQKSIDSITFIDTKTLSADPSIAAGSKTTESGSKDSSTLSKETYRTGIIKNLLSYNSITDADIAKSGLNIPGTVQSSALVMSGPSFSQTNDPESVDFISYAYKDLGSSAAQYKYFGTRVRLIGKFDYGDSQSGVGEDVWYTSKQVSSSSSNSIVSVKASSGGIAVLLNPKTNNGYYFEIAAISDTNLANKVTKYDITTGKQLEDPIHNLLFYKMNVGINESGQTMNNSKATPVKLWGGLTSVLVDSGAFVGQGRTSSTETENTVYDIGVEYEIVNKNQLKFYLYVNNVLVGTVIDEEPFLDSSTGTPVIYNNMGLFVRGKSKCMFEHVYAIAANPSINLGTNVISNSSQNTIINPIFNDDSITFSESVRKYALSGFVAGQYLKGIGSSTPSEMKLYFDEFGTIMREAAYFNVRYDKSYPAMLAQIQPTYNSDRGFTVSGFVAGPYSAEFLIFNATDSVLVLDGSHGNYLRISGVTFTQQSTHELTVDEFFMLKTDMSNQEVPTNTSFILSPVNQIEEYKKIINSRTAYGKKDFTLDSRYIQNQDAANGLMQWIINKIMKPRKSVGVKIFSMPTIQLGDIVQINMQNEDGTDMMVPSDSRFVVYQIDYDRGPEGPEMVAYLSEVV